MRRMSWSFGDGHTKAELGREQSCAAQIETRMLFSVTHVVVGVQLLVAWFVCDLALCHCLRLAG